MSNIDGHINRWFIILRNSTEFGASALQPTVERFGITGKLIMLSLLQLTVKTPNTSVVCLRCDDVVLGNIANIIRECEAEINLTIYGKCLLLCQVAVRFVEAK